MKKLSDFFKGFLVELAISRGGGRLGSQSEIVNPVHNLTFFVEPITLGDSSNLPRGANASS